MSLNEIDVFELRSILEDNLDFILLDVRTENEVVMSKISKSTHIPMSDIPIRLNELDQSKKIIVYCKSGKRSAKVCEYLLNNKFINVKNLRGGILSWAEKIDSNITVY
tara:strand:- start:372 stop:695 length:324 start_codon:yes stop_codon:yes gene_type:complete